MSRRRIVLLGIGHTNADIVRRWVDDPLPNTDLIGISRYPRSTYSGMLPGTLGGQFTPGEMRIDLQPLFDRAGARLLIADTTGLDLTTKTLTFADAPPLDFDVLSIGVGSMPAGWQAHVDHPGMIPIKPMQTFLDRLHARLEQVREQKATPPQIAIVGGGVASVEIALCLDQWLRQRAPGVEHQIAIYTSDTHVARGMKSRSIRKLEKILQRRGIVVVPNQRIESIDGAVMVSVDGTKHDADAVIWATGAAAPPVLERLGLESDRHGFVATKPTLQSLSSDHIFAVGDSGTMVEEPSPKAGVYAVRQCPILWHNLRAILENQPLVEYEPQADFLKLLNTGDGKALLEYGRWSIHARWCWHLKTWIDKRFIREFQFDEGTNDQ